MIQLYHNPRCKKSREGLAFLEASGKQFEVILYLKNIPTKEELSNIIKYLNIAPLALVRKNEVIWKEKFKGTVMSDEAIIAAMITYPKLIERPIIINNERAVIGRPAELIHTIL